MRRWPKFKTELKAIIAAERARIRDVRETFKRDLSKERATWETKQPSMRADAATSKPI